MLGLEVCVRGVCVCVCVVQVGLGSGRVVASAGKQLSYGIQRTEGRRDA